MPPLAPQPGGLPVDTEGQGDALTTASAAAAAPPGATSLAEGCNAGTSSIPRPGQPGFEVILDRFHDYVAGLSVLKFQEQIVQQRAGSSSVIEAGIDPDQTTVLQSSSAMLYALCTMTCTVSTGVQCSACMQ